MKFKFKYLFGTILNIVLIAWVSVKLGINDGDFLTALFGSLIVTFFFVQIMITAICSIIAFPDDNVISKNLSLFAIYVINFFLLILYVGCYIVENTF